MKAGGKSIALSLLCLAAVLGISWAAIALPPWIREERVLARLKTKDRQEQIKTIEVLAGMGSVRAIPQILEIMWQRKPEGTDHVNFREALKSIIEKRGREAVSPLVRQLKSPDRFVRQTACEALGDIGPEAALAIPALEGSLADPDPAVRVKAAKALFEVGAAEESYRTTLEKLRNDPDRKTKIEAANMLTELSLTEPPREAIPALIQALDGGSAASNDNTLRKLARFGPEARAAIPTVMEMAKASKVRLAALDCLGSIGADQQDVQDFLVETLGDPQPFIRVAAANALFKMGARASAALPALKKLLETDTDRQVHISAAFAVLQLEPENTLATSTVRTARDDLVNRWARSELRSKLGMGWDPNQTALCSMGLEDRQLRVFTDALKDPDINCRIKSLYFFSRMGPAAKPALGAILEAARDPHWSVRAQAAETLGAMGPAAVEAIPVLNELLKARNAAIRDNARQALRLIKGP